MPPVVVLRIGKPQVTRFARVLGVAGVLASFHGYRVSASHATQEHSGEAPKRVSLCTLAKEPALSDGLVVEVVAEAVTDMHDFVVLLGAECAGKGVALQFPEEPPANEDLQAFRESLFGKSNTRHTLYARFVGRFESYPGKAPSRVLVYRSHQELARPTKKGGESKG